LLQNLTNKINIWRTKTKYHALFLFYAALKFSMYKIVLLAFRKNTRFGLNLHPKTSA